MGGSISRRFNRTKRSAHGNNRGGNGGAGGNQLNKFGKKLEATKSNYNVYSIGLGEAKSEEVEDALLKEVMRTQLALDSQVFVLNQLLLGVQFFANYDV